MIIYQFQIYRINPFRNRDASRPLSHLELRFIRSSITRALTVMEQSSFETGERKLL